MTNKDLKKLFDTHAVRNGFKSSFGGWCREYADYCMVILELQKSNFGNYYILNVKVYFYGVFGQDYAVSKELIKSPMGDMNLPIPERLNDALAMDVALDDSIRFDMVDDLFNTHLNPLLDKVSSKSGMQEIIKSGELFILPSVIEQLKKLNKV